MDAARLAAWLAEVSPPGTAAAARPIAPMPAFDPAEEAAVARAVPRRRDEFRSGRDCARRALAGLGCPPRAIPADARRLPVWPEGYLGSISHGAGLCVAQAARADRFLGIGIDVEGADAVDPGLADTIAAPDEWAAITRAAPSERAAAALCFSAKEAVYKACFPFLGRLLAFRDVRLEVDWPRAGFAARLAGADRCWRGRFLLAGPRVATAVPIPLDPRGPTRSGRSPSPPAMPSAPAPPSR
jgi:4'-phosphopantetheinyl transferase EntD